jgi:hypothetical protein
MSALIPAIIRPSLKRRAPAAYQILADWAELAGPEVSAFARPLKLAGGTLTLGCHGPAAMELQYRAEALIKRINIGLGSQSVERLKFIQEPPSVSQMSSAKAAKAPASNVPEGLPDGPIGAALAQLYQGISDKSE